MNKREFVQALGGASLGAMFGDGLLAQYAQLSPAGLAREEDFWATIRARYRLTPDYINVSAPSPTSALLG